MRSNPLDYHKIFLIFDLIFMNIKENNNQIINKI